MISEYDKWFWKQCDELNKDTNLAYTLAKDAWEFQQIHIDELTQTLIKEQEEVLKYKPIYLNLIAENVVLEDRVKTLTQALDHISFSTNKSISYEHDLFDKGWNQCAKHVVDSIYKLTEIGSK